MDIQLLHYPSCNASLVSLQFPMSTNSQGPQPPEWIQSELQLNEILTDDANTRTEHATILKDRETKGA